MRYRQWDDDGWFTNRAQGTVDIAARREDAPLDFMEPYPASVPKLLQGLAHADFPMAVARGNAVDTTVLRCETRPPDA